MIGLATANARKVTGCVWVRGQARDGTTRFYRLLTAYVIRKGLRVTLAIRFVLPEYELVGLLDEVLKSLKKQGLQVACLYLDKGFASIDVMAYLTRHAQPALIACPIRGKTGGTARAVSWPSKSSHEAYLCVWQSVVRGAVGCLPQFHHRPPHQADEAAGHLVALHLDSA